MDTRYMRCESLSEGNKIDIWIADIIQSCHSFDQLDAAIIWNNNLIDSHPAYSKYAKLKEKCGLELISKLVSRAKLRKYL